LILNQKELADALAQKYGLETILMGNEDHTFEEQIKKLRRARVVLAMHGSILIMTMFCRRGTVIIEMFPFAVPSENYTPYKTLANLPGMDLTYRAWENPDESASVGHPHKHELHGGLDHLSEEERQKVLNTKTVPPHKCCSSPYWLYRIYQDTIVNIKQVLEIIDQALEDSRTKTLSVLYEKNWEETDNLMPSTALNIKCVDEPQRQEGYLWLEWDSPWNGIEAEDWHVFVSTTHQDFLTNSSRTSIYIPGFKTNTSVRVFIRPIKNKRRGKWSYSVECTI
jgi:protein O-mannose beta-1,4-N-acetylglucosaminyltransferase